MRPTTTSAFCSCASELYGESGCAGNVQNTSAGMCRPCGDASASRAATVVFPLPGGPVTIRSGVGMSQM
ncbi:MAG TPA: hypothetical protein VGK30_06485 [Candidatus Binatia bacterium]|jgi:hypothetical protein